MRPDHDVLRKNERRTLTLVTRAALTLDGLVFAYAALLNLGVQIPLGFVRLGFPAPVWQAGVGEAVIGVALVAAGLTAHARFAWVAFALSVAGIAFGLSSRAVQGPAREIHLILVPLAVIVFGLLLWRHTHSGAATATVNAPVVEGIGESHP